MKSKSEFLRFIKILNRDLKRHHPFLFQLQNLTEFVRLNLLKESEKNFVEIVKRVEEKFKSANNRIAFNFLKWLEENNFDKVSLATLSYSGTVLNCICEARDKISKVYVFRSCPKCEGDIMAMKLSEKNLKVFLVNDFGIDYIIDKVDFVVSGCDAVFKNGNVLNKAGTSAIFKLARIRGKETIILADSSKFVNKETLDKNLIKQMIELGKKGNYKTIDVIFEIITSEYITHYITEVGVFKNKRREEDEVIYSLSKMFNMW
ncbi:MAG: hypothetical protein ABDI07_07180 [Candidatus Kryptonium sp.]